MGVEIWTVVLTHNRHEELLNLLTDLSADIPVDHMVVVDHASEPPIKTAGENIRVIRDEGPANISRLWNIGLDAVDDRAWSEDYHVAVLNDDLRVPKGTLPALSAALVKHKATIAFPDQHHTLRLGRVAVARTRGPYNLFYRMAGYCWMLNGASGLRLDEDLVFWYGDDDLEWRAAERGGVVRVGGVSVDHLDPSGSVNRSPELARQTGLDRDTFIGKWGEPPW